MIQNGFKSNTGTKLNRLQIPLQSFIVIRHEISLDSLLPTFCIFPQLKCSL